MTAVNWKHVRSILYLGLQCTDSKLVLYICAHVNYELVFERRNKPRLTGNSAHTWPIDRCSKTCISKLVCVVWEGRANTTACRERAVTPLPPPDRCTTAVANGSSNYILLVHQPVRLIRVILKINYTTNNYNYLSHALPSMNILTHTIKYIFIII